MLNNWIYRQCRRNQTIFIQKREISQLLHKTHNRTRRTINWLGIYSDNLSTDTKTKQKYFFCLLLIVSWNKNVYIPFILTLKFVSCKFVRWIFWPKEIQGGGPPSSPILPLVCFAKLCQSYRTLSLWINKVLTKLWTLKI